MITMEPTRLSHYVVHYDVNGKSIHGNMALESYYYLNINRSLSYTAKKQKKIIGINRI